MGKQILLVEDDFDSQTVVSQIITHLEHTIDVVSSAEEAASYLFETATSYDLVIIDLRLPGENGWYLLNMIKGNPTTAQTPCIAVTGYSDPMVAREAKAAGFDYFIPKPITATVLLDAFAEMLV